MADHLQERGYVVGSRRHVGGAGDLLAVHESLSSTLIEVKTTAGGPWERFGPVARHDLYTTATRVRARPCLAWAPRGDLAALRFIYAEDWPSETPPPWGFGTAGGHGDQH